MNRFSLALLSLLLPAAVAAQTFAVANARILRLTNRGRIAPGLRADLVLVAGDPLKDITETRNLVRIWKGGVAVKR